MCCASSPRRFGSGYRSLLDARTITEEDIERHMMTTAAGSPPLDILIRTSGVKRFSDFLLWQVRDTVPVFSPALTSPPRVAMIPKYSSPRVIGQILACEILFPSS